MTKDEIDKLILDNVNIAYKISWNYYRKFRDIVEFEELKSVASLGLVKAANTFNKLKKYTFSTYSYKVITNEILMYLRYYGKIDKNNVKILPLESNQEDYLQLSEVLKNDYNLEEDIELKIEVTLLYKYIDELPDNLRDIILLKLDGKTQQEIADIYNLSQTQISRLLADAIYQLRLKFNKKGMM